MEVPILGRSNSKGAGPASEAARPPSAAGPTVLGPGTRFVGELSGDEDIVVHGRFQGTIRVDRQVTVGAGGDVEGEIHGRQVVVAGRVRGDVHAAERAELTSTGAIEGGVHAPKVVIAEGARLEGSVAMAGPGPAEPAGSAQSAHPAARKKN